MKIEKQYLDPLTELALKVKGGSLREVLETLNSLDFIARDETNKFNQYYIRGADLKIRVFASVSGKPAMQFLIPSGHPSGYYIISTFEEFFEACPDDIKEKVIYNLDLFRG